VNSRILGASNRENIQINHSANEEPVIRQDERDLDLRRWPTRQFDIICGDVNAHSILWDDSMANKRTDKRGRMIENWAADNNMLAANDGSFTHVSRSSGSKSAPDVTLAHASIVDKLSWKTVNSLGSDHMLIVITYSDPIPRVNSKPSYKWKLKDADWSAFRQEVESKREQRGKKRREQRGLDQVMSNSSRYDQRREDQVLERVRSQVEPILGC